MLKKIVLENWRSHKKSEIELQEGANMFLGPMGSGKSSVVDAIAFGLYGTYPKLGRRDAKLSDVKNFRHIGEIAAVEIELAHNFGGQMHEYKVRREVEPAGAWLYKDGKLVCKGARAVRDEIEEILQIPYELFARAVYAEQNKLDYWLSLSAGERKAEIDSLLNLDKFEAARSGAMREAARLCSRAGELEAEAPIEALEDAKSGLEMRRRELGEAKKLLLEEGEKLEAAILGKKAADEAFSKIEKDAREFERISRLLSASGAKIEALEKNIASIRDEGDAAQIRSLLEREEEGIKNNEMRRGEIEKKLRVEISRKAEISHKIFLAKEKISKREEFERRLALLQDGANVGQLEAQKAEIEKNLQDMRGRRASLVLKAGELAKILEAFEAGEADGAICPMCESQITPENFERVRGQKIEERDRCKRLEGELGEKIGQDGEFLARLVKKIEGAKKLSLQIGEIGDAGDLGLLEREFSEIEKKEGELGREIENLKEVLAQARVREKNLRSKAVRLERAGEWKRELGEAVHAREEEKKKLDGLSFLRGKYDEAMRAREMAANEYARIEQKIEGQKKICSQAQIIVQKDFEALEKLEKRRAEAKKMREEADEVSKFREAVVATQAQLRESLIGQINSAMQKLWRIIYPYGDWSDVRLLAGEKDYSMQIHQGEWRDLEAHASGGERACLGLCLRAAMSVMLTPHLGWLILDEPTHNLDEVAVRSLAISISEQMPKIVPQILVITHDEKLLESAQARVLHFERDKLAGEDTRVFEA
ncbi:MAG: SMC family ATPase [Candidatus Micrarchaeota archaeon]